MIIVPEENEDPYERIYHQTMFDIRQIETDAGVIENPEVLVFIRKLLLEKRKMIMEIFSKYVAPLENQQGGNRR